MSSLPGPTPTIDDVRLLADYKFEAEGSNKNNKYALGVITTKTDGTEFTVWETFKAIFGCYNSTTTEQKIVRVERSKIDCMSRVQSIFGFGDLAHIDIKLVKLERYLAKFDWKNHRLDYHISATAYITVCTLAQRLLGYKQHLKFWEDLGRASEVDGRTFHTNPVARPIDMKHEYIIQRPYDPCFKPFWWGFSHHGATKKVSLEDLKVFRKQGHEIVEKKWDKGQLISAHVDDSDVLDNNRLFSELYTIKNTGFRAHYS